MRSRRFVWGIAACSAVLAAPDAALAQASGPSPRAAEPATAAPREPAAGAAGARAHIELYKKVAPAVVAIESLGSGVLIDSDGLILTSSSVVPPRERVTVIFADGVRRFAKVVARAPAYETALVKVEAPAAGASPPASDGADAPDRPVPGPGRYRAIALADGDPPLGRVVYTLGNAFQSLSRDGQVSMSVGVVSGGYALRAPQERGRATYTGRVLEVSAAVNPGMSGAPVIDREGRLVGLVTLNFDESRWLGTAVPIAVLRPVIEALKSGREPPPPAPAAGTAEKDAGGYLGIEIEDAPDGGVVIQNVAKGSPAERIDLRVGDRIAEWNGEAVDDQGDFLRLLAATPPGARVRLSLEREEKSIRKMVELGKPPEAKKPGGEP